MSREGQKGQTKGWPRKASGAPRGARGADKGLVTLLASAPGTSVKALQGQFLLCTLLGVMLLGVLLFHCHRRPCQGPAAHPPAARVQPPRALGAAEEQQGQRGQRKRSVEAPAWDSEEEWDAERGAGQGKRQGKGQGRGQRQGKGQGKAGRARGRGGAQGWAPQALAPHLCRGRGALSSVLARGRARAKGSIMGAREEGATPWFTKRHQGRALGKRYPGSRGGGAGQVGGKAGGAPPEAEGRRTLPPWAPQVGRYFLAFCQLYQWTRRSVGLHGGGPGAGGGFPNSDAHPAATQRVRLPPPRPPRRPHACRHHSPPGSAWPVASSPTLVLLGGTSPASW